MYQIELKVLEKKFNIYNSKFKWGNSCEKRGFNKVKRKN